LPFQGTLIKGEIWERTIIEAIEVNSGDYFLGSTPLEAINNNKQRYPKEVFHVMKVGHKAAIKLKGGSLQWHQADGLN